MKNTTEQTFKGQTIPFGLLQNPDVMNIPHNSFLYWKSWWLLYLSKQLRHRKMPHKRVTQE